MIHERCLTYFNVALRECPHCGMLWCPRCRAWFRPSKGAGAALAGKEADDGQ